jgi:hypothetical protein
MAENETPENDARDEQGQGAEEAAASKAPAK